MEGDPELLRRAVENVIRNAIRYAPRGDGGGGDAGAQQRHASWSTCAITVRACPRKRCRASSIRSIAWRATATAPAAASASDSRSRAAPSSCTKGQIRARNAQPGLEVELELPVA